MKIPTRSATVILGIILLGCAVVALIKSTNSSPEGNERVSREPIARPGDVTNGDGTPGKSGGEAATSTEGEPIGRTKVRQRPVETALDKKLRERQRLVEALERYKGAGLAGRHPDVVKATDDLRKIEAELAAAGDGTKPVD